MFSLTFTVARKWEWIGERGSKVDRRKVGRYTDVVLVVNKRADIYLWDICYFSMFRGIFICNFFHFSTLCSSCCCIYTRYIWLRRAMDLTTLTNQIYLTTNLEIQHRKTMAATVTLITAAKTMAVVTITTHIQKICHTNTKNGELYSYYYR